MNEISVQIKYKKNYIQAEDDPFDYEMKEYKLKLKKNLKDNLNDFYYTNGIKRNRKKMFFYIMKNEEAIKEININQPLKFIKNELKDNIIFISPYKMEIINDENKNLEKKNNDEIINKNPEKKINGNPKDKSSKKIKDENNDEILKESNDKKTEKINDQIDDEKTDEINHKNIISIETNKEKIDDISNKNNDKKAEKINNGNISQISNKIDNEKTDEISNESNDIKSNKINDEKSNEEKYTENHNEKMDKISKEESEVNYDGRVMEKNNKKNKKNRKIVLSLGDDYNINTDTPSIIISEKEITPKEKINNPRIHLTKIDSTKKNKLFPSIISEKEITPKEKINNTRIHLTKIDSTKKNQLFCLTKIFTPIIISLIVLVIIIYFILKKKKKNEIIPPPPIEKLMANLNYKKGEVYLYKTEEKSDVISKKENDVNSTNFVEYKNYLLLILEENNDTIGNLNKIYYTGIFSLISSYIKNETKLMLTQLDDKVNDILQKKTNLRRTQDNNYVDYHLDNITNPFFKIEFYKNGIIRNISIPEGFNISYMTSMKTLLNLTIPKLSKDFYVDNIEDQLNKNINQKNKEIEEEDEEDEEVELRFLNINEDNDTQINSEQILASQSDNNELNANTDLMQIEKIKNEKNENISKITELVLNNINNEYAIMEGGTTNTTRTFYINENSGSLVKIEENSIFKLDNQNNEDDEEDPIIHGNINDNNNLLQINDIIQNQTSNLNDKKFIKPDFILNTTKNVTILDPVDDPNIFNKLSNHFKSFKYSEFNKNNSYDKILRLLSIKDKSSDDIRIEIINHKIRKTVDDVAEISYYGLKKHITPIEIIREHLMGINMNQEITTEFDPSSGLISSYVIINLGNIIYKVSFPQYQTNLNIIIENINQFAYCLIQLIGETDSKLKKQNNVITGTLHNAGKESMRLLEVSNDFSHILEEPLNNIYDQMTFSTTNYFTDLINIIKEMHNKFSLILNDAKTNKYEKFNEIRKITKEEYITYIENITYILENFYNNTLDYINDIGNELKNINNFQIDALFDIIDSINDCKEIMENFNFRLFDSIERGIIQFKYDLNEYFEIVIGSLLYVTEFLSVNINKNEILKKSIDEQKRNEVQILLKDFRYIINQIIDLLLNNIHTDYEFEFSENIQNSIKYKNIHKINDYLFLINNNSSELINDIKRKINFINKYSLYVSNIDEIDRINNKTISEFNNDFYNGCIKNLLDIKPDFYDKNNKEIIQYKEQLENISNKIKNEINNEILEINNYVFTYTKNYFNENLFKIHQNLYNFRELFLEKEMTNLVNEFELSIIDTIDNNLKQNIKYNFDLANNYLRDVEYMLNKKKKKLHFYLTKGFQNHFNSFQNSFKTYLSNIQSFYNLLDKHFYKIRDNILEYIDNKINSLNKYYFDSELYKDNFYYIEQVNKEIYKLSNNINNFYNKLKLESEIKIKAIKLINTLNDYYNDLLNQFYSLYSNMLSRAKGIKSRNEDFEYWNWRWPIFGWKKKRWCSDYRNNINNVKTNLNDTDKYLEKKTNEIINNFENKFSNYLSNYICINQNLFDSLYSYIHQKINNNDNIIKFSSKFENIINEMKSKYTIQSLQKKYKTCDIESFIINLGNNMNLIKDNYYNLYYKMNKSEFLEYPEEIEMKINNIYNEALKVKQTIKEIINSKYAFKISQVNKLSNIFINDLIAYNKKYTLNLIKFPKIIEEYKIVKFNFIADNYDKCNIQKISENNNLIILNQTNFDNPINNLFKYFIMLEQNILIEINNSFFICNDTSNPCKKYVKFKSNIGYSELNFNVYKLRSSIYYSRNMIKNLYKLFEGYTFDDIINYDLINYLDEIINDKGFFELYNKSNIKLNQINNETYIILKPLYELFIKDFSKKYTLENDYLPFTEYLKKILNASDSDYLNYTNKFHKNALNDLDNHLNKFNEILNLQINLTDHYIFSTNISYLNDSLINLNKSITKCFNEKRESILNNTGVFNVLRNVLDIKNDYKVEYFKKEIDEFYKNFEIKYLNYTLNLGDYISKSIKKEYYDYTFKYVYEYIELFEDSDIYFDKLYNDTLNFENEINIKYKKIYDYFNLTYFSKKLDIEIENYENSSDYSNGANITEEQIKEYYSNFEYNNEILNSIIFNITKIIYNLNKKDYLFDYLNDVIQLRNYNITLNDMSSLFQSFNDYTAYINYNKNKEYKDLLNSSLITYYNESYTKFIKNYISEFLLSNIDLLIEERIIFEINIFENKLSNDYNYFTFLINKTKELGSTKSTLNNLYNELKIKINETIIEYLNKYLFSCFDQFIRNKNKFFREKYLSFYSDNKNKNNFIYKSDEFIFEIIKEPSFNETLNKIYFNVFNKTVKDKINLKLNQNLYKKLNDFYQLLDLKKRGINDYLNKVNASSQNNMDTIKNLIDFYNQKITDFNSKYDFYFSNRPFLNINDFINDYLNPPLTQIKNKYNEIEKELLDQSIEKLNNLEDFSSIIENDLNLESKISKLTEYIETIKSNISEIIDLLFKDVDQYYCELAYFKVIEGQKYLDKNNKIKLCNASLFFLNNETFRRLKEKDNKVNYNISKYLKKIPKFNYTKYNSLKRILEEKKEYDSNSPSLSKKDITFFYLLINETLNELTNEIMGEQSKLMNLSLINSINEIIYKILPNLKFSVDRIEKKYNSILTEDNLNILHKNMYYQYNRIENISNHYINKISENMNSVFNTFTNSKNIFNFVNNLIYNIIMENVNKMNENILKKRQVINNSSEKRMMSNDKSVITGGEYEETQEENDNIEQKMGYLYYIAKDKIQILELENEEFLDIVDKDFKKNENNSLINSIGRYVLKNDNSTKPEPSSYHKNLKIISFSLPSFELPFFFPLVITTSYRFDNINIYLEIGEKYIYDDEDKETPIDIIIYQFIKMILTSNIISFSGIYLPFGLGNMHIGYGFNGILSRATTNTNIKMNILNNTYLIEFNETLSKEYSYFLKIGITVYILFIPISFDFDIFNIIIVGSIFINYNVQNSFREPLLDSSPLAKVSYYSYNNHNVEQIEKLMNKI